MMTDIKNKNFSRMDSMHHILSGFKVTFTAQAMNDVEESRRCCGGAGYQSNSGFTSLYAAISPMPTYEGENTVMLGQASPCLYHMSCDWHIIYEWHACLLAMISFRKYKQETEPRGR